MSLWTLFVLWSDMGTHGASHFNSELTKGDADIGGAEQASSSHNCATRAHNFYIHPAAQPWWRPAATYAYKKILVARKSWYYVETFLSTNSDKKHAGLITALTSCVMHSKTFINVKRLTNGLSFSIYFPIFFSFTFFCRPVCAFLFLLPSLCLR